MDNRTLFCERLKKMRKDRYLSVKEFSEFLEIKDQTYYTYERGTHVPTFDILVRIARKCEVSLDWLCGLTTTENLTEKKEISFVLSQLRDAYEMGRNIDIHISCQP